MPEITADEFGLEAKSQPELEQRRQELVTRINSFPKKYEDPDIPTELLRELALVAGMLRRKTSGPPKAAKPTKRGGAPKTTAADLANML